MKNFFRYIFINILVLVFVLPSSLAVSEFDRFHKGRSLALEGNGKSALGLLNKIQKDYPYLDWYKAIAYEATGDTRSALLMYDKLIKEKDFVPAILMRADVYNRYGNYREAIKLYEKVKTLDPAAIFFYRKLAYLYYKTDQLEKADQTMTKYVSLNPKDDDAKLIAEEIKEKLGDEFFERKKRKARKARKELDAKVDRFALGKLPLVKVAVAQGVERFELKATDNFDIYSQGNVVFKGKEDVLYDVCLWGEKIVIKKEDAVLLKVQAPVEFHLVNKKSLLGVFDISHGEGNYWTGKLDTFFRGYLRCIRDDGALTVVNVVNIEEYVYGVLPSEMFATWPLDALKAQAVLARTLALKRRGQFKDEGYDFENSTRSQVYLGVKREQARAIDAVDQTRGVVLTHDGKLSEIFFSSNSGGHTVNNGYNLDYYKGVSESLDNHFIFPLSEASMYEFLNPEYKSYSATSGKSKSTYRWQRLFHAKELVTLFNNAGYACSRINSITVLKRNLSGHVEKIKVDTDRGEHIISNELKIRKAFGNLRSSLFRVELIKQNSKPIAFLFWGGGFGHGIGLSQYGAKGMAEAGHSWKKILKHYFPKLDLRRVYK